MYISRAADRTDMLIKREKWRKEGKISQRDRRNKKNERNTKEQETGSSIIAGCWTNSPQRTKKNKNRYKFHFVFYPPRNSVTSPMRGPLPSAVALLFVRRRIGNGRRTRIILLVAAVETIPLSCLIKFILIHRHKFKQKTEIPWKERQEPDSLLQLELERNNLSSIEALTC